MLFTFENDPFPKEDHKIGQQPKKIKYNISTQFDSKRPDIYINNDILNYQHYSFIDMSKQIMNLLEEDNSQLLKVEKESGEIEEEDGRKSKNKEKEGGEDNEDEYKDNKSSLVNRYFNTNKTVKCHNCNEIGHISKFCPNERIIICNKCNKEGHLQWQCPNIKCFKCNKIGHKIDACQEVNLFKCDSCGSIGHKKADCLKTETYKVKEAYLCFSKEDIKRMSLAHFPKYDTDDVSIINTDEESEYHRTKLKEIVIPTNEEKVILCPKCVVRHNCMKKCERNDNIKANFSDDKRYKAANYINNRGNLISNHMTKMYNDYKDYNYSSNYSNYSNNNNYSYSKDKNRSQSKYSNFYELNKEIQSKHSYIDLSNKQADDLLNKKVKRK